MAQMTRFVMAFPKSSLFITFSSILQCVCANFMVPQFFPLPVIVKWYIASTTKEAWRVSAHDVVQSDKPVAFGPGFV